MFNSIKLKAKVVLSAIISVLLITALACGADATSVPPPTQDIRALLQEAVQGAVPATAAGVTQQEVQAAITAALSQAAASGVTEADITAALSQAAASGVTEADVQSAVAMAIADAAAASQQPLSETQIQSLVASALQSALPTPAVQIQQVEVTAVPAAKETIVFSDLNWASAELQTRIAQYIVEHGYGYPVDAIFGDTTSMQLGLASGDTQVTMEIWLPNQQVWWDKEIKDGGVIPVGKSLDDNWQSAFVIPTYLAEENPGLVSVFDLPDYMDLFVTPESGGKALLVSCVVGWQCELHNESQVNAYGLADVIELQTPGSQAALDAAITGAYEKGEPVLFYYWGPTKIAAELDLTLLEEPAYTDACWAADKGCGYPLARVLIAVHPSLILRAPDVVEMLRKWDYTAAAQVTAEGWMSDNEATSGEAAINFLKTQDVWMEWVTDGAASSIAAALALE
jgi:glycine betaine/proline transport system substrate-binding protein